ncbi:anthranilate synthase component I, partial [bacterium]|nr:anthranilate synthase component I [bacterium]
NKEQFKKIAEENAVTIIPIVTEITNDEVTPISVFKELEKVSSYAYMLESVENGENLGRYTFLGTSPLALISYRYEDRIFCVKEQDKVVIKEETKDPLSCFKKYMAKFKPYILDNMPPFSGGAVGYVGYDIVRTVEDLPNVPADTLNAPDMYFMISDTVIVFDHLKHKILVCSNAPVDGNIDKAYDLAVKKVNKLISKHIKEFSLARVKDGHIDKEVGDMHRESNFVRKDFENAVEKCKEYIKAGDILQVVLSQRFSKEVKSDPFSIYRALRTINPSPYMFYLKFEDMCLVGSSPETMVKVIDGVVSTKPIAGTRKRGSNEAEDTALAKELLADEKERAEHLMLVDLGRNDIGRIADIGSVKVIEFMQIEKYSHVMHIVSEVEGKLAKDYDIYDAIKATFPAGTVSGAPKIRAMEIIDELEPTKRGPYAGLVGYASFTGQLDTCITIRTIICKDKIAYVQAGAGLVADSDPEKEYEETVNKAMGLMKAVEIAGKRV